MRRAVDAPVLPQQSPPRRRVEDLVAQWRGRAGVVLLVAALMTVLALGRVFWRQFRSRVALCNLPTLVIDPTPEAADLTVHWVRGAYRSALASLARVGLGRAEAETPAEHAARVSAVQSGMSGALCILLNVYALVRYGLSPSEEGAQQAEEAAGTLARLVGLLPAGAKDAELM